MLRQQWVALALAGACVGTAHAKAAKRTRPGPTARVTNRATRANQQALWHIGRGFQFYECRAFADAECQFRQALRLQPRNAHVYTVLGDIYATRRDQLELAVGAYQSAIRLAPRSTSLYERLGITYERLDKPHLAASVYRNVIWIDARDSSAHQHLGWALQRMGQHREAILAYQRALQLDPRNSTARCRLNRLKPAAPRIVRRLFGAPRRA